MRTSRLLIVAGILFAAYGVAFAARSSGDETLSVAGIKEDVKEQIDWVRQRRTFTMNGDPYGMTSLPIVFYTPSSGFHYGGWVEVANYSERPYAYRVNVQWYLSTKGKRNHHLRLEFPSLLTDWINMRIMTQDLKDVGANFFGIGNDSEIKETSIHSQPDYYVYHLEQQRTGLDFEGRLWGPLSVFAGVRANRGLPSRVDESKNFSYYVFNSGFTGVAAGWSNFFITGFIIDTRNDVQMPTRGTMSELSVQKSYDWLGSDYEFRRITAIHTHYHPVRLRFDRAKYILVNRFLFENMNGTVPFYELTQVGGSIRGIDVGGTASFRGYESRRFADRQKFILTSELRRFFPSFRIRKQFVQSHTILFTDIGRVADKPGDLVSTNLHACIGAGFRVIWNTQLSLRTDYAVSPEGEKFYLTFGSQF